MYNLCRILQHIVDGFTVLQRGYTPSALHSTIVFLQISSIFCIEMFAKLVYNTK